MKAYRHYPHKGDVIYSSAREEEGLSPGGRITFVDRDSEEVHVQWDGRKIVSVIDCFEWNGFTVKSHHFIIDGVRHHSLIDITQPQLLYPGGEIETLELSDIEGCWSSRDGGKGAYYI